MPYWKDVQSKLKIKRRSKFALSVLVFLAGLLFLSWTIHFTQTLFSPWKLTVPSKRNYLWNGQFNLNLIIHTTHISLFSYSPKEEKIVLITIPDETYLEVPGGFGFWQLRAIYNLGQSSGIGGHQLLADSLTKFLAVPIDGFLDFSALEPPKEADKLIVTVRRNPIASFSLLPSLKTNLTLWELVRLKLGIDAVRFDKIKQMDLLKLEVLNKDKLPDGTEVYTADPVKLDSILSDLADPTIVSEHHSIAVFNATKSPQLAQKTARLITNLGGNVIIVTNARRTLQNTQIVGKQSLTLQRLQQIFGLGDKIDSISEDLASSRAEINLFLGEDWDQ